MSLNFLIDECLSPKLAAVAIARGFHLSTSIRDRGLAGRLDHEVARYALDNDLVLVTHNARDFRGQGQDQPGGLYAAMTVHPGLICLVCDDIDFDIQSEMFNAALDQLNGESDLINQCLELQLTDSQILISLYEIPALS